MGDYIDDVPSGSVVVLDNSGRTDCTVWGDILTGVASRRGIAGTVINGVCRDVARARSIGYPVFSRGSYMRTGKDRVEVDRMDVPVSLGEVQVRPGDILVGDGDGVVVIPRIHEDACSRRPPRSSEPSGHRSRGRHRHSPGRGSLEFRYHQLQDGSTIDALPQRPADMRAFR